MTLDGGPLSYRNWPELVMKCLTLFLLNAASAISFLAATLLIKLRLRREPDPWRRTVGTGLRSEASKFGLSAFEVYPRSPLTGENFSVGEQHFTRCLAAFLQAEPSVRFALRHDRFCCYRVANRYVDVALAEFSPWGELRSILPMLDDSHPVVLRSYERSEVERLIVEEYNRTRRLPELVRPRTLIGNVKKRWFGAGKPVSVRSQGATYAERILNSSCVSFEATGADPFKRFEPPDFQIRRIVGAGFLNVVCRRAPSGATDIWMQVHHTGADGSPMQELLTRLEQAWGTGAGTLFPTDTGLPPKVLPCFAAEEERPLHLVTDFIDFSPLFQLRNDLKERFAKRGIEAVPLSALFLWCLAHQPEFEGIKFANAVDVPANETKERGVDLVPIRPSDYWDQGGFAAYLRDFNQLILDARNRRTRSYLAMRNLAVLPPMLASAALRLNPGAGRSTFGTVGVSIVKDAKVVVGTMADQGFDGGFILIGSMLLPCPNGRTSGAVSIKGEYAAIRRYPMAIRRAIQAGSCLHF
jgi:hypothetical protein